jgi:hypothetical protein
MKHLVSFLTAKNAKFAKRIHLVFGFAMCACYHYPEIFSSLAHLAVQSLRNSF